MVHKNDLTTIAINQHNFFLRPPVVTIGHKTRISSYVRESLKIPLNKKPFEPFTRMFVFITKLYVISHNTNITHAYPTHTLEQAKRHELIKRINGTSDSFIILRCIRFVYDFHFNILHFTSHENIFL
jgi:hypothetical protein